MTTDARSGMTVLDEQECWAHLAEEQFGRLAVAVGGRPDIFPINFVPHEGAIYMRTAEGSKLASIVVNQAVAFEVDGYHAEDRRAWSVVAHGLAHVVGHDEVEQLVEQLPLFPWNTAPKNRFVQFVVKDISGRSFIAEGRR
ncbi:MAG: pyridoxamine 5'-phosphate oxidase family protein [Candidatus Nanopelagicales bacterium]